MCDPSAGLAHGILKNSITYWMVRGIHDVRGKSNGRIERRSSGKN
jgi:hypothetical protein